MDLHKKIILITLLVAFGVGLISSGLITIFSDQVFIFLATIAVSAIILVLFVSLLDLWSY